MIAVVLTVVYHIEHLNSPRRGPGRQGGEPLNLYTGLLLSSSLDQSNSGPSRHLLDMALEEPAQSNGKALGTGLAELGFEA